MGLTFDQWRGPSSNQDTLQSSVLPKAVEGIQSWMFCTYICMCLLAVWSTNTSINYKWYTGLCMQEMNKFFMEFQCLLKPVAIVTTATGSSSYNGRVDLLYTAGKYWQMWYWFMYSTGNYRPYSLFDFHQ